ASTMVLTAATEGTALAGSTTIATFTDTDPVDPASDFTASIHWGDGSTTAGTVSGTGGSFTVTGGHTYADEGSDAASVVITRTDDARTTTPSGSVAVAEGDALTPHGAALNLSPNVAFSGAVATFTDTYAGNTASDFTASIDWGDGTTTSGTVSGGSGTFTVSGGHTYTAAGTDSVHVTLTDDAPGTATATATTTANVSSGGGQTFILTTGTDHFTGGSGDDTVIAAKGTVNGSDTVDMDGGNNTLALQGPGAIDLRRPKTLTNIQVITAQEGQPAAPGIAAQKQTVYLRDGLDATVNVSAASLNP